MPSKNDLTEINSQLKKTASFIQQKIHIPAGRKTKSIADKQSEIIGLRFTPSEYKTIKKQAGLVPIATFLKNELLENSLLF